VRHAFAASQGGIKALQVEKEVKVRKAQCWKKVKDWLGGNEEEEEEEEEDMTVGGVM